MQTNEMLGLRINTGLFPQLAFGGLNQRFVRFEMPGGLIPQRFAVDRLFYD
ncbi:hypothetical protein D3C78_1563590 [compost metagenome]